MSRLEKILEKIRLPLLSVGLVLTGISCYTSDPKDYIGYYLDHQQTNKKYSAPLVNSPIRSSPLVPTNPPETPKTAFLGNLKTFQDYVATYGWAEIDDHIKWYDLMQRMNLRIEQNQDDAIAYIERAKAELNLKLFDACTKDCDAAFRLKNIAQPEFDSALYCCMYVWDWIILAETEDVYFKRADVKHKLGLYEGAIADYRHTLKINPDNKIAKNNLEFCLKKISEQK